jgi:hypothetical protein
MEGLVTLASGVAEALLIHQPYFASTKLDQSALLQLAHNETDTGTTDP